MELEALISHTLGAVLTTNMDMSSLMTIPHQLDLSTWIFQGSLLLFLMYLSDLPNASQKFADDTVFIILNPDPVVLNNTANNELVKYIPGYSKTRIQYSLLAHL